MKVLFAVSNEEISEAIVKKYQKEYKEIISYKNVYYFNAILKEIQKDKTYDRIVISEELEAFANTQYDQIDKFIFEKLDSISDEAASVRGENTPIILICSDRRTKGEEMLVKLFGIGIYDALIGNDRSVDEVCKLIYKSRSKKEAKMYYKVEADEVKYQAENENDVSEQEIQNILAHYKKLGRNEEKYVISFDNIVAQYNDAQLRIISKFLPLNVRTVLEEKSPKYQQIMSFNNAVSDKIRKKEKDLGPSGKLLKTKNSGNPLTEPVVIPSAVNTNNVKKLTRNRVTEPSINEMQQQKNAEHDKITNDIDNMLFGETEEVKRRGRPKKSSDEIETNEFMKDDQPKRRGRPRKNPIPEETFENILPGFDTNTVVEEPALPGFEDYSNSNGTAINYENGSTLPGFENVNRPSKQESYEDNSTLPGFENVSRLSKQESYEDNSTLPGFENVSRPSKQESYEDNSTLPGFENVSRPSKQESNEDNSMLQELENAIKPTKNNDNDNNIDDFMKYAEIDNNYKNANQQQVNQPQNFVEAADFTRLLTSEKKVVTFVGTSKNGTSFVLNNLAEYASSMGINVAILDTTQNKNSYYIYTRNEEELRQVAGSCLNNLVNGQAKGISVNRNLTVYTSLPEDRENLNNVNSILETLVRMHNLVLIDCDFKTPYEYFLNAQEIYLVQSLDILTIQPLTAFLRELKAKNVLNENKLRIILNKYVKVRGISDKTIIGGMSKYNDPAMSFMTDLFDMNAVKHRIIPFEQDIYTRYLESIIDCDVSIKGYSKTFMQVLRDLTNWIYPMTPGSNTYRQSAPTYNGTFSPSMNNTLNKMKGKY